MNRGIKAYSPSFYLALAANTFFFLGFQASYPVLPRFIAEVVLDQPANQVGGEVGLATSAVALVAVLARIPTGQLADWFGRRRFMVLGATCFALAPLIYMVSRSLLVLLLGRVVQGVGLATFTTAFQALITDLAPEERRGEALGLAGASVSVAFISAPLFGDWLASAAGYTLFFQISAATAAVSLILTVIIAAPKLTSGDLVAPSDSDPVHRGQALSGLRLALAQRGVRASVLTMAALGIPFGAFISFLPLLTDERQVGGAGVVFSVYAGTILLAQPSAGWLSDRLGRPWVIVPGLAITSLATGVLAQSGSLWTFVLASIIFGVGGGLARGGVDALAQDSVPATLRSTAAAIQYTSFDFWIGLGSYPVGLLANTVGYATTFAVAGAVCLLGDARLALLWIQSAEVSPNPDAEDDR